MSEPEARRAARRALGNVPLLEEQCRDKRARRLAARSPAGRALRRAHAAPQSAASPSSRWPRSRWASARTPPSSASSTSVARDRLPIPRDDRVVVLRTYPLDDPSQETHARIADYFAWRDENRSFASDGRRDGQQRRLRRRRRAPRQNASADSRSAPSRLPRSACSRCSAACSPEDDERLRERADARHRPEPSVVAAPLLRTPRRDWPAGAARPRQPDRHRCHAGDVPVSQRANQLLDPPPHGSLAAAQSSAILRRHGEAEGRRERRPGPVGSRRALPRGSPVPIRNCTKAGASASSRFATRCSAGRADGSTRSKPPSSWCCSSPARTSRPAAGARACPRSRNRARVRRSAPVADASFANC